MVGSMIIEVMCNIKWDGSSTRACPFLESTEILRIKTNKRGRKSYVEKIAVNELLKTILETVIKFSSLSLIFRNKTWYEQLRNPKALIRNPLKTIPIYGHPKFGSWSKMSDHSWTPTSFKHWLLVSKKVSSWSQSKTSLPLLQWSEIHERDREVMGPLFLLLYQERRSWKIPAYN